ncbi:MAG TPA: alpha/beta hydrolase family protein [bacterium]|nr:alpha/beta hydrolase family protein [bacterium]HOL94252.1 alpha/beta hydrolase family protein [bacterium]HPP02591.1 alpha/beta hydrolase family protein [bacterium]
MNDTPNAWTRLSRRTFSKQLLLSAGLTPLTARTALPGILGPAPERRTGADTGSLYPEIEFLANRCDYPLSFLHRAYSSPAEYRQTVQQTVHQLLYYAPPAVDPRPEVIDRWETPAYTAEKVLFNTTPWFRIPAYVLIPKLYPGKRPAIVDLHCHAGNFLFGKEKVMPVRHPHPALVEMKADNYDGQSTSEKLVERGYVVISIDRFYFGERRTLFDDLNSLGMDLGNYTVEQIRQANRRAAQGEATLVKALFWAGATWNGIACWDDIRTVDYLVSRPEVDPARVGCLGISMGGDRANYLCALDDRIQCGVSVGWMATLRPLIKAHIDTHSFSHFLPGLTHYLDLPDLLGAFVPKPLLVLQCAQDGLYTLESMKEACDQIQKIYAKAGAEPNYQYRFYDQPHRFSKEMQEDAFQWLDKHLQG